MLNSAERAPYLLLIEILNGDLDFDPERRTNKEVLRKLVTKEVSQRGDWSDFGLTSDSVRKDADPNPDSNLRTPLTTNESPYYNGAPPTAASSTSAFSNDEEEMDLVEQLYGEDQPLRSRMLDIEESIVLPPTPKNKELDMATWARSSPMPVQTEEFRFRSTPLDQHIRTSSLSRTQSQSSGVSQTAPNNGENTHALSLDEYSERMRTAAIMLAQLNADQGRETANTPQKVNGSPRPDNILDRTGKPVFRNA